MSTLLALYMVAGLLLVALSVPLIRRKIGPNSRYGFRVPRTLDDPAFWYAANAYAGKYLLGVGVVTVLAAIGRYNVPGITLDAYVLACAGVVTTALAVCIARSFRYLKRLARESDTTP